MLFVDDRVALVRCDDYDPDRVTTAVSRSIELLGGLSRFVSPGQKVLVKPNLLQPVGPERCVTTHPEVVRAVAALLREHGCEVVIADSAGGGTPFNGARIKKLYNATGMNSAADRAGASLWTDMSTSQVVYPGGRAGKMFPVISPAAKADAIVVVSKAKTHVFTSMTGATKCLFGILPGMEKPSFHGRLSGIDQFCDMLLDLNEAVMPRLQIMDAVMGMEGDGPSGGTPRRIGAVLASGNPVALDIVAAKLMGFRPEEIPLIRQGVSRSMVPPDLRTVVLGESVKEMTVSDFKHPKSSNASKLGVGKPLIGRLLRAYALVPVVERERCTGCGRCASSCPRGTIEMVRGRARISHGRCVRCYCCHEMCESGAIELRRTAGGRLIALLMGGEER